MTMTVQFDDFTELSHGQHEVLICRRIERGEDELKTFVLDSPVEDIGMLMLGLALVVNDPEKLEVKSPITNKIKEEALALALSLHEMLNRCYNGQHAHTWSCIIGDSGLNNITTDTAAALIATAYAGKAGDGEIEGNDGDDKPKTPDMGPFPPGTTVIDMP